VDYSWRSWLLLKVRNQMALKLKAAARIFNPTLRLLTQLISSNQSECEHGLGDFHKTGDVGAVHIVARRAKFLGGFVTTPVNAFHDYGEFLFGIFEVPDIAARVLLHFERGSRHATRIGGFAGTKGNSRFE